MNIQKFSLFLLVFILGACSGGKPASQTSFELSGLSALVGDSSTILGGLVLTGSNGIDKFTAGLTPQQISTFNVDLPQGDWNFSAIAWLGVDPMTGATQCGLSTSKIEGASIKVTLALNASNCQLPQFATSNSFSLANPSKFKTLTINSCLNPVGKAISAPCDGSDLANYLDIAGEHLSFKVEVASGSNFGANFSPLTSKCYSVSPSSIKSGVVHTTLTLPYGGANTFPLRILAYENIDDCSEVAADADLSVIYPIIGGIHGTQGLSRSTHLSQAEKLFVNIADNYIGTLGSAFLSAHLANDLTLPFPLCGNSCFHTLISNRGNTLWHDARDAAWSLFNSPQRKSPDDFQENTIATNSSFFMASGMHKFTISTLPGKSEGFDIEVVHNASANTPNVTCSMGDPITGSPGMIFIEKNETVNASQIVAALMSYCSNMINATMVTDGPGIDSISTTLTPTVFPAAYQASRRQEGSLNSAANMLVGPIGAVLFKNGVTTFNDLCNQNITANESLASGERVTVQLGPATLNADIPTFPISSGPGSFERKILISFDSVPEEAIYFNCAASKKSVGAYVRRQDEDGEIKVSQLQWDNTGSNQWAEEVSFYENTQQSESSRNYRLASIYTGEVNLWTMKAGTPAIPEQAYQQKLAIKYNVSIGNIHIQDSSHLPAEVLFVENITNDRTFDRLNSVNLSDQARIINEPGYGSSFLVFYTLNDFLSEQSTSPTGVFELND